MMDLKKYCKSEGISTDTARRRIKSGEIKAKIINGKYYILDANDSPSSVPNGAKLKEMKTAVEIKWIQQRIKENEEAIRMDERSKFKEKLIELMKGLPEAFRNAKLSEEQTAIINSAFDDGMIKLEIIK